MKASSHSACWLCSLILGSTLICNPFIPGSWQVRGGTLFGFPISCRFQSPTTSGLFSIGSLDIHLAIVFPPAFRLTTKTVHCVLQAIGDVKTTVTRKAVLLGNKSLARLFTE
ncbi:hypothetical protein GDO78_023226 [Eleutherodactylus coqui]|uniref:Secreted protein n=1 Tax=Eleutherodactylus coqui TaxID=57060 RepID=A0A8J6B7G8_ELECQ|nr:hypothetical protein GDO78_023226 [Eleutherodactylus coqui]